MKFTPNNKSIRIKQNLHWAISQCNYKGVASNKLTLRKLRILNNNLM